MKEDERILIINELEITDKVFISIDRDRSVCLSLEKIYNDNLESISLFLLTVVIKIILFVLKAKFVKNWESN